MMAQSFGWHSLGELDIHLHRQKRQSQHLTLHSFVMEYIYTYISVLRVSFYIIGGKTLVFTALTLKAKLQVDETESMLRVSCLNSKSNTEYNDTN